MVLIFHMSTLLVLPGVHNHPISPLTGRTRGILFLHSAELCQMDKVIMCLFPKSKIRSGSNHRGFMTNIGQRMCYLDHEFAHLPEGCQSVWSEEKAQQHCPARVTACISWCISNQAPRAMVSLTH